MEGDWIFYRETGQLWQKGNFRNGKKHGSSIRYDKKEKIDIRKILKITKLFNGK
jgi:antitoxin component YwqK of YwqJK toxin-antitoxin module